MGLLMIFCHKFDIILMSSTQQSMNNWLDDSHGQVGSIPSHLSDGEDTDPLHLNVRDSITAGMITRQQTKREHTAPKVLLSLIRQILYWNPNTTKKFKDLLREANSSQNNSTPIKLYILAQKVDLLANLRESFPRDADNKLEGYYERKDWSERRYVFMNQFRLATAKQWQRRIEGALGESNSNRAFKVIWEGSKHPNKYATSQRQVNSFKRRVARLKKEQLVKH